MYVDIHTHTKSGTIHPAIRNLTFSEAETFFSSNSKETVSLGIHPWVADNFTEEAMSSLRKYANDKRLIIIGECGLDKNAKAPIEKQLVVFNKQVELSEQVQKPLIIHCIGLFNQLFELKKVLKPQQPWIIHGFRGKPELAKQALTNDCILSFGQYFNPSSVLATPLEKLFIETDESNLSIEEIYGRIAIVKQCTPAFLTAGEIFFKKLSINN